MQLIISGFGVLRDPKQVITPEHWTYKDLERLRSKFFEVNFHLRSTEWLRVSEQIFFPESGARLWCRNKFFAPALEITPGSEADNCSGALDYSKPRDN